MRFNSTIQSAAVSLLLGCILSPAATADVTSPAIKDRGKSYSSEKPLASYYGTGSSGRMVEASELRLAVEDLLGAGEFEKAIPRAKKAVQLDPGDPAGHLMLAKALTGKFYQQKGEVDEKLLGECLREWQLLRYHDSDPTEQWEAGNQAKQLQKIARALEKEKRLREKEKLEKRDESTAKDTGDKNSHENLANSAEKSGNDEDGSKSDAKKQVAERKKHFGVF